MKAIVFENEIKLKEIEKPTPKEGEALVKILLGGICNTDLELAKGYMGFSGVLGHEFVGVVEEINAQDKSLLNKRVVGEINCGCEACEWCYKGFQRHCPNRQTLGIWKKDGCFSEYLTMPIQNLIEVPETITNQEAVLVEPLAAALEILEQLHIKPDDKVIILGDGKLGLNIALTLNTTHCDLMLIGKHQNKLDIVKNQGIKTKLLSDLEIKKEYDIVVDATGSINGFETALNLTKPRGVLVLKSTVAGGKELNLAPIVIDEITILGSRCGQFAPALRLLNKKMIDVKPFITKTFKVDDALEAFEASRNKENLKILVDFT